MEAEYKKLNKEIEKSFKKVWGPRCTTKDLDDFPELKRRPAQRCVTCSAYDKLDDFLADLHSSL